MSIGSSFQDEIHRAAGWGMFFGFVLAVLGIVAIAAPFATAITVGVLFGWLFILGGIAQLSYAFLSRPAGAFLWKLLLGIAYLLAGIWIQFFPGIATLSLALILAISILFQSVIQVVAAITMRPVRGWGWMLFSGISGLVLGALIWAQGPGGAAAFLGLWFGMNLLFDGAGVFMASSLARAALRESRS